MIFKFVTSLVMASLHLPISARVLPVLLLLTACATDDEAEEDYPIEVDDGCDAKTVLPSQYRPIPTVSEGVVDITTSGGVTSGTLDATAGGFGMSADRPYLYVDLRNNKKAEISDVDAFDSADWDIALKRSSIRLNSNDSGAGGRGIALVEAESLAEVKKAPIGEWLTDDFTTDTCTYQSLPAAEPITAFGEWYAYDEGGHGLTPKPLIYVIKRRDNTKTALRIISYYGDPAMPTKSAFYRVEWKQL